MARAPEKLRMTAIGKSFPGVRALDDVTFSARAGEVIGLIGVNGAGKSTLMNILGGIYLPDEGGIEIDGKRVDIGTPTDAEQLGIAFIHQELLFFDSQTVAENIFIADPIPHPTFPFLVSRKRANERARQVLDSIGSDIPATARMENLSVGQKQIVEIARAVAAGSEIVIFDEPTSSLSVKEKDGLFSMIRKLKSEAKTIVYISHFLDEIIELCDRFVVLRNGKVAGHGSVAETTKSEMVRMVVGKELVAIDPMTHTEHITPMLKVEGVRVGNLLDGVGFELNRGEVLGLWGLMGSGRTELIRALVGLDPMDEGSIAVVHEGRLVPISPSEFLHLCGYVTENRRIDGLFLDEPVWKNITVTKLEDYASGPFHFLDGSREAESARDHIASMQIKTPSHTTRVANLSGGNQQKVILSKWLEMHPPILILDEPTRGVDVGAKQEIARIVTSLAAQGTACLLISSEVEEIVALCDRVLVLRDGMIIHEARGDAIAEASLMAMALGEEQLHA